MSKIIDVDVIGDFDLELTYEDGMICKVNLFNYNNNDCFKDSKLFVKFGLLPNGDLQWLSDATISSDLLREIGENIKIIENPVKNSFADMISMAFYDAVIENRPEIIQAALKTAVEKYGTTSIAKNSDSKSRTSIYKSLNEKTNVTMFTVVNLAHTVMKLEEKEDTTH